MEAVMMIKSPQETKRFFLQSMVSRAADQVDIPMPLITDVEKNPANRKKFVDDFVVVIKNLTASWGTQAAAPKTPTAPAAPTAGPTSGTQAAPAASAQTAPAAPVAPSAQAAPAPTPQDITVAVSDAVNSLIGSQDFANAVLKGFVEGMKTKEARAAIHGVVREVVSSDDHKNQVNSLVQQRIDDVLKTHSEFNELKALLDKAKDLDQRYADFEKRVEEAAQLRVKNAQDALKSTFEEQMREMRSRHDQQVADLRAFMSELEKRKPEVEAQIPSPPVAEEVTGSTEAHTAAFENEQAQVRPVVTPTEPAQPATTPPETLPEPLPITDQSTATPDEDFEVVETAPEPPSETEIPPTATSEEPAVVPPPLPTPLPLGIEEALREDEERLRSIFPRLGSADLSFARGHRDVGLIPRIASVGMTPDRALKVVLDRLELELANRFQMKLKVDPWETWTHDTLDPEKPHGVDEQTVKGMKAIEEIQGRDILVVPVREIRPDDQELDNNEFCLGRWETAIAVLLRTMAGEKPKSIRCEGYKVPVRGDEVVVPAFEVEEGEEYQLIHGISRDPFPYLVGQIP